MNPYYSGLGIARSLAPYEVAVYGLTSERDAPGVHSRHFRGIHEVPNGRDEPERLRDWLVALRSQLGERPILFPTRDLDVVFLQQYRADLADLYILPQPDQSPILRLMDKLELAKVAADRGIATPRTVVCTSEEEIARQLGTLSFPVVMKPRFAYEWRRKGVWEKVGAAKALIASSPEEVRSTYRQLAEVSPAVLLQEFVPGTDSDIVVCGCYIDRHGSLLGYFTGRKIRQNPPLTGTGSLVAAGAIDEIVQPSRELLCAFKYSGLAEVEFKRDSKSGRYYLIEVNPRHWDQHELGTRVGVNLSWIAYCDLAGLGARSATPIYKPGRPYQWLAEREHLEHLVQRLLRERLAFGCALRELISSLAPRTVCGVMSLRDPLPGLLMSWRLLADGLRHLVTAGKRITRARFAGREPAGEKPSP